jgi:hypothetical protein
MWVHSSALASPPPGSHTVWSPASRTRVTIVTIRLSMQRHISIDVLGSEVLINPLLTIIRMVHQLAVRCCVCGVSTHSGSVGSLSNIGMRPAADFCLASLATPFGLSMLQLHHAVCVSQSVSGSASELQPMHRLICPAILTDHSPSLDTIKSIRLQHPVQSQAAHYWPSVSRQLIPVADGVLMVRCSHCTCNG